MCESITNIYSKSKLVRSHIGEKNTVSVSSLCSSCIPAVATSSQMKRKKNTDKSPIRVHRTYAVDYGSLCVCVFFFTLFAFIRLSRFFCLRSQTKLSVRQKSLNLTLESICFFCKFSINKSV